MDSGAYDAIFALADAGQQNIVEVTMDSAEILLLAENQAGTIASR